MYQNNNTRGSIMVAALIVTLILGSLVGLYLKSVTQEVAYSYRSRMAFQTVNVAEAGLEFAMASLHSGAWTRWTKTSKGYYRRIESDFFPTGYNNPNKREDFWALVYIEPNRSPPAAIAEGIIRTKNGTQISRQVYIELGNRSPFANGVLAKDSIKFNGQNIKIDSYMSRPAMTHYLYKDFLESPDDPKWDWKYRDWIDWVTYDANGNPVYSQKQNYLDNGTVATISMETDVVNLGNADIWGRAATGGSQQNPNYPKVGPNGSVNGEDTPAQYIGKVDPNRIALDFTASMPDARAPYLSSPLSSISGNTIGTTGTTTAYRLNSLSIDSKETYTIKGNVTIVLTDDLTIKGKLVLDPGATVKIYVGDDVEISGSDSAIVNPDNSPTRFILYSTGKDDPATPTDETPIFKLAGNGSFYGAVYAPNAAITLDGSGGAGEMFGAVVGKTIDFSGGYRFHYDEALADLQDTSLRKVTRWVELTDAGERKNMATILTDGL